MHSLAQLLHTCLGIFLLDLQHGQQPIAWDFGLAGAMTNKLMSALYKLFLRSM